MVEPDKPLTISGDVDSWRLITIRCLTPTSPGPPPPFSGYRPVLRPPTNCGWWRSNPGLHRQASDTDAVRARRYVKDGQGRAVTADDPDGDDAAHRGPIWRRPP
jgi:hypothetical protein